MSYEESLLGNKVIRKTKIAVRKRHLVTNKTDSAVEDDELTVAAADDDRETTNDDVDLSAAKSNSITVVTLLVGSVSDWLSPLAETTK